jgi:hypothetical protein
MTKENLRMTKKTSESQKKTQNDKRNLRMTVSWEKKNVTG